MFEQQIERAKNLILSPKTEWEVIDGESVEMAALYKSWIMPLAAIPAIASFIGTSILGVGAYGFHYRVPFFSGLVAAAVSFVIALAGVFLFAHIISFLAPYFGAQKNLKQAFKVAAYMPVAAWLSGVFLIIPSLSLLALIGGLYSLYLLFVGVPVLMNPGKDKAVPYTITAIIGAIVMGLVLSLVSSAMLPHRLPGAFTKNTTERAMEKRTKNMEKAAEKGDLGGMLAAMTGGSNETVSDPEALKKLAPAKLGGLKRTEVSVETLNVPLKAVTLKAVYEGDGGRSMTLSVTNSPGVNVLKTVAGMTGNTRSIKKDDGSFEKLSKEKEKMIIQNWDAQTAEGTYAWSYKNFIVSVEGQDMPMKTLKKAAEVISSSDLDRLKKG